MNICFYLAHVGFVLQPLQLISISQAILRKYFGTKEQFILSKMLSISTESGHMVSFDLKGATSTQIGVGMVQFTEAGIFLPYEPMYFLISLRMRCVWQ